MDSKTFARTGKIAIGLRSFCIEEGGLIFGTGTISTISTQEERSPHEERR